MEATLEVNQMQLQLFTIHHRHDSQLELFRQHFSPMQVGSAISSVNLGILRDDTNFDFSSRNKNFCELTAFEEILRIATAEYVGVMHYRRIFISPRPLRLLLASFRHQVRVALRRTRVKRSHVVDEFSQKIPDIEGLNSEIRTLKSYLNRHLADYDMIVPIPIKYYGTTLRHLYATKHFPEHYDLFLDALERLHPVLTPFVASQDENPASFLTFNMFIMRRAIFQEYWHMLSTALFEMEAKIDLRHLDPYQARVFGFLAERFMAIFVRYAQSVRSAKCGYLPVALCDLDAR